MHEIELVIFDCDGVLIDSELIAARVEAQLLTDNGYKIEPDEITERYSGLPWKEILVEIERSAGIPFSASLIEEAERLVDERLESEVEAIAGAAEVVEAVDRPKCVCSNSSSERLRISLSHVGLYDALAPHIYSAIEVGSKKGKPAPDVFLYAAEAFGADPARTVVIEDSVHGVTGARAAGMRVIGFTGAGHTYTSHAERLTEAGAETVISRLRDLPAVIEAFDVWSDAV